MYLSFSSLVLPDSKRDFCEDIYLHSLTITEWTGNPSVKSTSETTLEAEETIRNSEEKIKRGK